MKEYPLSRAEAVALGVKRYYDGKVCKRGHNGLKAIGTGCVACSNLRAKESASRRKNEVAAYQQQYRIENLDKLKAYRKDWGVLNLDQDSENARLLALYHSDRPKYRVIQHNSRARQFGVAGQLSIGIVSSLLEQQQCKCKYCQVDISETWEIDHRVAIACGGTNTDNNIQLLCKPCNSSKQDKNPDEYEKQIGFKL